jgi:CubicO group peptidase (beta-lactamase class C family)
MSKARIYGKPMKGLSEEVIEEYRPRAGAAMERALPVFKEEWVKLLSKRAQTRVSRRGKGRIYTGLGALRQSSAAGQIPAMGEGELLRSLVIEGPFYSKRRFTWFGRWGTDLWYAKALNYGTSRMAARPFINRIQSKAKRRVNAILDDL